MNVSDRTKLKKTVSSLIRLGYDHPDLRVHLRPVIASYKIASVDKRVLQGGERLEVMSEIFALVELTYASIGVPVSTASDLLKYDVWWVYFHEGHPVAFCLLKTTSFGMKVGLMGSDGQEGKPIILDLLRSIFHTSGFYGEVSHKVKDIVLKAGAPKIPVTFVEAILGKEIRPIDDFEYIRYLTGVGDVEKVMVGRPVGNVRNASVRDDFTDICAHAFCQAFRP
jgi:hypothetical protein